MRKLFTLLYIIALPFIAWAEDYTTERDISYRDGKIERCKLDVHHPVDKQDCPVVVWFHGGGLEAGSKEIPRELQNQGIVVVGVNYRLLPKATPDECIDDAAAAVAWAFKNIEKYGGSTKKIFVSGHSAGGYLTMMVGLNKKWLAAYGEDADSIAGLVPFSGQCVTHYNVRKIQGIGPLQPTIDEYAPITFIRPDCAPMVIVSGDRNMELYGRYEEQAYFWRMLQLVGHKQTWIYEMQGFDHGQMAQPGFKILKDYIWKLSEKK